MVSEQANRRAVSSPLQRAVPNSCPYHCWPFNPHCRERKLTVCSSKGQSSSSCETSGVNAAVSVKLVAETMRSIKLWQKTLTVCITQLMRYILLINLGVKLMSEYHSFVQCKDLCSVCVHQSWNKNNAATQIVGGSVDWNIYTKMVFRGKHCSQMNAKTMGFYIASVYLPLSIKLAKTMP